MTLSLRTTVDLPFADAVARTRDALAEQGFGVLTEIDVQATMKSKLDADMDAYLILGACNPPLAHKAITAQPIVGVLLPCNVVVREEAGAVVVEAIDPVAMMSVADDPALKEVADEAAERLGTAIASLS
jgi:uncharacterized protein (DUF302 family)